MQIRSGHGALATALVVGALSIPWLARAQDGTACPAANNSDDPCFANVSDILGGQRHLLRNDDLIVNTLGKPGNYDYTPFFTTGLDPTVQPEQKIAPTSCDDTPYFTRIGRMYNQKNDVIVAYAAVEISGGCSQKIFVIDPADDHKVLQEFGTFVPDEPRLALLDADLDGYDDIFVMNNKFMQFYSPPDVTDPSAEMVFRFQKDLASALTPGADPVSGDFNGDGAVDIAWLDAVAGEEALIHFASVCPAKDAVVLGTTCSQGFEIVLSPEMIKTGELWFAGPVLPGLTLTAGDFDGEFSTDTGAFDDELVLIIRESPADTNVSIFAHAFDFDKDLNGTRKDAVTLLEGPFVPKVKVSVASGRLDWSDRKEQVVVAAPPGDGMIVDLNTFMQVLTFDTDLTITVNDDRNLTARIATPGIVDVAIGRFDPPDSSSDEPEFNQQVALLVANDTTCEGFFSSCVRIDTYTWNGSELSFATTSGDRAVAAATPDLLLDMSAPLQIGDLQGRSLRLGAPEKVTVVRSQVDAVLGVPPMHVDFVPPPPGDTNPAEVYNVSVFPDSFLTQYDVGSNDKESAKTTATTSYTSAFKESGKVKVSYGIPDIADVSVTTKLALSQTHDTTVADTHKYSANDSMAMSSKTDEFDDVVSYTSSRLNIYSYPVIGQKVCPAEPPTCADDEKEDMYVQFSGADNVNAHTLNGGTIEWYQPVHEPGNVFSYPGSVNQLKSDDPDPKLWQQKFPKAGEEPPAWGSQTDSTVSIEWESQSTDATNTATVATHTFDGSISVSGEGEIEGVGIDASATFDHSTSNSTSTLNASTTVLGESTGVILQTRGTERGDVSKDVVYQGKMIITGRAAPKGTLQEKVALPPTVVDAPAQGPLRVAFVTDLEPPVGDWWERIYTSSSNPENSGGAGGR